MENLIVGEGYLELNKLAKEIEKTISFVFLVQAWKQFGERLGIGDVKLLDLERRYGRRDVELSGIPREIIKAWKSEQGKGATLKVLYNALVDCGVRDIAETLADEYYSHEAFQKSKFELQGKIMSLEELLGDNISEAIYRKIYDAMKNCFSTEPIQLLKEALSPPVQPKYYIPRTLSFIPSTEIDTKIFLSEQSRSHIFLVKRISKPELAKLTGYKAIEKSGNQLHNVNVRFILLECDDDFARICTNTTKPVHVIEREGESYFWVKSRRGLDLIRMFLKSEAETIEEETLATKITTLTPPSALTIADSPGMGKTLLLANLAKQIKTSNPSNAIHLFIVLQEFANKSSGQIDSSSSVIKAIAAYCACNDAAKLVLSAILSWTSRQVYLYLDGYDEVMHEKLDFVNAFLEQVQKLRNFIVVVTSRTHQRTTLENIFNQFGYEIKPFHSSKRILLLTMYWVTQHEVDKCEALELFAWKCLEALETTLNDKDKEIAGIPLQCMMLGEVYAEDAKRISNLNELSDDYVVQPISFFQMFQKLIELKFSRITDPTMQDTYRYAHFKHALVLLLGWSFNEWEDIDETTLYSIGLLKESPTALPRFVHQTYAEYLLAEFIVNNLNKYNFCADLLFGNILGRKGGGSVMSHDYYTELFMAYPVVGYFVEMHLKENLKKNQSPQVTSAPSNPKYTVENLCKSIFVCCCNDLEHTFDYATKVATYFDIADDLRDEYFKALPHIVAVRTNNVALLEKVLEFTKSKFKVELSYHIIKYDLSGGTFLINKGTPLHVAAREGKYNMVTWLVELFEKVDNLSDRLFKCVLHACVRDSVENSKLVLEEKQLIIDMLVEVNREWIDERDEDNCTPMLQQCVHLDLLKRLLHFGADINAYSSIHGTVIHRTGSFETIHWAFANGFNLLNHLDDRKRTPLMIAIGLCKDDEVHEVLNMFQNADVDWNAVDKYGDSVLFYALKHSLNFELFQKLVEYGANVNHKNMLGQNALHIVMKGEEFVSERLKIIDMIVAINPDLLNQKDNENITPLLANTRNTNGCELRLLQQLVDYEADINAYSRKRGTILHSFEDETGTSWSAFASWAISKGFRLINHMDGFGETPLMHAIWKFGTVDDEVFNLFLDIGIDFGVCDAQGRSILSLSLALSYSMEFITKLLECEVDVNHTTKDNQNAGHMLVYYEKLDSHQKLKLLKLLVSKGFNRFADKDNDAWFHGP